MMKNYSDIKNMDELNEAIVRSGNTLRAKEKQVSRRVDRVRSFYTPTAFLSEGARQVTKALPLDGILLTVIDFIRRRLKK